MKVSFFQDPHIPNQPRAYSQSTFLLYVHALKKQTCVHTTSFTQVHVIKAQSTDTPNSYPVTMVIHCLPHTHKHAAYSTLGKTGRRHAHCSFLSKQYLLPSSFYATPTAPNSNSKCGSDWIHALLLPQHKTPALTWEGVETSRTHTRTPPSEHHSLFCLSGQTTPTRCIPHVGPLSFLGCVV